MTPIVVSRRIPAPWERVWERIADISSHPDWMKDARTIAFGTDQRAGPGTVMHVETRLGPFRATDVLEVTGWVEGRFIEVEHRGLVRGRGLISIRDHNGFTLVEWHEDLAFPWWLGGALAAWLARPFIAATMSGNLRRLEALLTSP